MDNPYFLVTLAVLAGILFLLIIFYLNHLFIKLLKLNPLVGLAFFYFIILKFNDYLIPLFPNTWQADQFHNPLQTDSSLGFFLKLNKTLLSPVDIVYSTLSLGIIGFFCYRMLFIGSMHRQHKKRFSDDWSPSREYQENQKPHEHR